jgi:hypothetical protein
MRLVRTLFSLILCGYFLLTNCLLSWIKQTFVAPDGRVNCSDVVMSDGKSLVLARIECYICGSTDGLKTKCNKIGCRCSLEKKSPPSFHISCARQAGLELSSDEPDPEPFAGTSMLLLPYST